MCKNSGFRSRIQKSYKKFGIESKNLIIFSESIPNLLPHPCFLGLTQILRDSTRRWFVEICVNSWQKNLCKKIV